MHFGFLLFEVSPTSRPSVRAQFLQVPFSSALGMSHPSLPPESPLSLPFPKASVKKQFDISVCESGLWRRQGLGSEGLLSSAMWRTRCFAALHVPILANSFLLTQQRLTEKQLLCTALVEVWGSTSPTRCLLAGERCSQGVPLRGAGRAGWLPSDAPANSPCEQHLLLVCLYLIFSLVRFLLMHCYSFFCTFCWCRTWCRGEVSVPVAYGAGAVCVCSLPSSKAAGEDFCPL